MRFVGRWRWGQTLGILLILPSAEAVRTTRLCTRVG